MPSQVTATEWRLLEWNPCSISNKYTECACILADYNPDALCIPESHLKPGLFIQYEGYKVFRNDRLIRTKGGVAILVKNHLRVLKVKRSTGAEENLEWLALLLDRKAKSPIWLLCLYVPDGNLGWDSGFLDDFIVDGPTIVAGDFNARHPSFGVKPESNRSGKAVNDLLYSGRLVLLGGKERTHRAGRRLDLWLCSPDLVGVFDKVLVGERYGSDHHVVSVGAKVGDHVSALDEPRWNYTKANWPLFKQSLAALLAKLKPPMLWNPATIRIYDSQIRLAILEASKVAIPKCAAKAIPSWLPTAPIKAALKDRHRLDRLHQRTGLAIYSQLANEARQRFKQLVEDGEGRKVERKLLHMEKKRHSDVRTFFQVYKQVTANTGAAPRKGVQPLKATPTSDPACSEEDQAEILAAHTAKALKLRSNADDSADLKEQHKNVETAVANNEDLKPLQQAEIDDLPESVRISWDELETAIKRLKLKAPGFDGIQNILLKRGGNDLWHHIHRLFNASLACGYVPEEWKKAIIVPLPRVGKDLSAPSGYRPVSLLLTLAKLLEAIFAVRLRNIMEQHKLFPRHQSGFRRRRATVDHLFALSQLACRARLRRLTMVVALLDFEGAFNAVWHDGLRFKLAECQHIPAQMSRWLSSFLCDRTFAIRIGAHVGEFHAIEAGVPQGSPLSPVLFAFFTADMLPEPGLMDAEPATFADDVLLHVIAAAEVVAFSRVNRSLRTVNLWSKLWRLPLNPSKCQAMRFGAKRDASRGRMEPKLYIGDSVLAFVDEAKYLGLTFTSNMKWVKHINFVVERVRPAMAAFRSVCRMGSPLSFQSRKLLYTAMIRPILEYGAMALLNASEAQLHRLEVVEHQALQSITQVYDYQADLSNLYRAARLEPLRSRLVRLAAKVASSWLGDNDHPTTKIVVEDLAFPASTPLFAFEHLIKKPN